MNVSLTFPAKYLRALRHLAAVNDVQYYIKGVILEGSVPSCPVLFATTGTVLGAVHLDAKLSEPVCVRIPHDVLAQLPAQVAEVTLERVHAEPTGEDWRLTFLGGALSWHWSSERHPDWRRVVPVKCNPTPAAYGGAPQFDPSLLSAMRKAVHTLGVKKSVALPFELATNADAGALVTCSLYPEFIGVVMPMRLKEKPVDVSPSWVRDTGEGNDFA